MADTKQILVVDDHFEMLEFLRSMLELSDSDCSVFAVPSAEEAVLEFRRGRFDLIITDVRLPGMSGFDFVRRVRRVDKDVPVMIITAYASDQGRQEASELGVLRYFQKPLDTDDVLAAVHKALYGDATFTPVPPPAVAKAPDAVAKVQNRLELLRTDTGAVQLMLASVNGEVLFATGASRLDLAPLAQIIARNVAESFQLANMLQTKSPFSLQYHAGDVVELYYANVGSDYFVTLFFDATARRGRIGTIWVFTQRAIADLQLLLLGDDATPMGSAQTEVPAFTTAVLPPPPETPQPPAVEPEPIAPPVQLAPLEASANDLAALFTKEAESEAGSDLDAFWSEAVEDGGEGRQTGLSWEEAQQQGLLSSDSKGKSKK